MTKLTRVLLILLTLFGGSAFAEAIIELPVRLHLWDDAVVLKNGQALSNWISEGELRGPVLAEVNRIWRPVGVRFVIESVIDHPTASHKRQIKIMAYVAKAKRDAMGKADPKRVRKLEKLVDQSLLSDRAINVHLIPYLGEKSQGVASAKKRRVFIGQWTDKSADLPKRVKLTEPGPFKAGSFSRTLAHELGHVLGLKHPNKKTQQAFGQLMGGKRPGYAIPDEQKNIARQRARALASELSAGR